MPLSRFQEIRINNTLPVAREGLVFIFISIGLTLLFSFTGPLFMAIIMGVMSLFTIYFFRDPERTGNAPEKAVLTPADGKIIEISNHLDDAHALPFEPAVKISIFMSVFNVHVNRISMGGKISDITYHQGKFFSANLDKASIENENNRVTLETGDGRKIVIVQIAGLIARRIACWIKQGDNVKAGQRFGLIRFGSRLDLYLPADSRIVARKDQKVKAGETILGYLS